MVVRIALAALVASVFLAGCASNPVPPASSPPRPAAAVSPAPSAIATDIVSLRDAFSAAGLSATASGPATGGVLPAPAVYSTLSVGGSTVQVYRYPEPSQMLAALSLIGRDGTSLTTTDGPTVVEWKGRPHFFAKGRLIVLFLSTVDPLSSADSQDVRILQVLERQLGAQVAGS